MCVSKDNARSRENNVINDNSNTANSEQANYSWKPQTVMNTGPNKLVKYKRNNVCPHGLQAK